MKDKKKIMGGIILILGIVVAVAILVLK